MDQNNITTSTDYFLPLSSVLTPLAVCAFVFNLVSFVFTFYLIHRVVRSAGGISGSGGARSHQKLRIATVFLLLLDRIAQTSRQCVITKQLTFYDKFGMQNHLYFLYQEAQYALAWVSECVFYTLLLLILLLTLERYVRVAMVLKRTWIYFFLNVSRWLESVCVLILLTSITANYISVFVNGREFRNVNEAGRIIFFIREFIEVVGLLFGLGLDYFFTLCLIQLSLRNMVLGIEKSRSTMDLLEHHHPYNNGGQYSISALQ